MTVTTTNGKTYRIQFVHSPHDVKHLRQGTPGGLRQIVDNLALSLRRRVTLCELAIWTGEEHVTGTDDNGAVRWSRVFEVIAQGFAICHYFDQFNKSVGREQSLSRALKVSGLDRLTQEELAASYYTYCK
jgi:hypothetical protein